MEKDLKILLTNDDGIDAPGLYALYKAFQELGEVMVVAPESERSAVGHAITLTDPLRVWPFEKNGEFYGYAVNGFPADCVKVAYWALLKNERKPDLVVSGINLGSNTGINVIYSGTVSAATEGAILGIPSFAVSLTTLTDPKFDYAAKFSKKLAKIVVQRGLPKGVFLNVNIPPVSEDEIKGVEITVQGKAVYEEKFDVRKDPRNRLYYWLTGSKVDVEEEDHVDDRAIMKHKVSITPIHYDLTSYHFLDELKSWKIER